MLTRRQIALGAAAMPLAAQAQAPSVVLGQIGLTFYQVVAAVVAQVLERRGVVVRRVEGLHGDIYPRLAAGEIDLLAAAWLPNAHGPLHAAAADSTLTLATVYEDARLYWSVPAYVPEAQVSTIDDLRHPSVVARMDRRIVGIGADSGLMRGAARIVSDYELDRAGYQLQPGPAAAWIQNAREQIQDRRWFVLPLWQPQWMNRAYALRILQEPRGIYQPDRCVLVAAKTLQQRLDPGTWRLLSRIELGVAAVTDMDYAVQADQVTPDMAARRWMASNAERVSRWFDGLS